jgi:hypothetical protein
LAKEELIPAGGVTIGGRPAPDQQMREKKMKEQNSDEEHLISQAKAAEMCGLTREAIHKLVGRGRLRASEVGGRDLVYLKEVEALARERQTKFD